MDFLIEIILFVIGFGFGIWYFGIVILPLFYGFPKALWGYFKKKLRLKASLIYLGIGIGWQIGLILIFALVETFIPITESGGFIFGSLVGFWFSVLFAIFRKETKKDMVIDFQEFTKKYEIK